MAAWGYGSYDYHDFERPPPPPVRAPPPYERPPPPHERPPLPRERPPPPPPPPREDGDFYHDHHGGGYGRYSPPPPPPPPPRNAPRGHPPSPVGYEHSPRGRGAINRGNSQQRGNGNFRGRGLPRGSLQRGGYSPRGTYVQRGGSSPRGPSRGQLARGGPARRGSSSPRGQTTMRGGLPQRGRGSNRGGPRNRGSFTPNGHGRENYTKASVPNTNTSITPVKANACGSVAQNVASSPANTIVHSDQGSPGLGQPADPYSYQSLALANAKRKLSTGPQEDVKAPGQANFISFKNSLQEYCQKKHMPVPAYNSFKNNFGYSAKVEVAGQMIQSSSIQKERKDAEQNAAYEALKTLGLIVATVQFTAKPAPVKRPSSDDGDFNAKKMRFDLTANLSFKSKLNEFCQKFRLPIPTYETVRNGKGFISTLIYNKKVYQSDAVQKTKKLAEQNAAQVVLHKLGQAPAPEPSVTDAIQKCAELCSQVNVNNTAATTNSQVTELATASGAPTVPNVKLENSAPAITPSLPIVTPLQDSPEISRGFQQTPKVTMPQPHMSYKNHLQEYCQKNKIELPQYETLRENGGFVCTVNVAEKCYKSSGCKTKKGSEQTVARVALQSMGLLQPNQV